MKRTGSPWNPLLVERWKKLIPSSEWEDFWHAIHREFPEVAVRPHPVRWHHLPISWEEHWHPVELERIPDSILPAFFLRESISFWQDPFWFAGAYHVQEPSGLVIHRIVSWIFRQWRESSPFPRIFRCADLCAAPGGKTLQIADVLFQEMQTDPFSWELWAVEKDSVRARALLENLVRWGHARIFAWTGDSRNLPRLLPNEFFDLILLDVPCSGEGYFRKDPASRTFWSPARIASLQKIQKQLLESAWYLLRPGGFLIYSTCTWAPEENEACVHWIQHQTQYSLNSRPVPFLEEDRSVASAITRWNGEYYPHVYGYRFYPHRVRGEGFFVSVLQKTGASPHREPKNRTLPGGSPFSSAPEWIKEWLKHVLTHGWNDPVPPDAGIRISWKDAQGKPRESWIPRSCSLSVLEHLLSRMRALKPVYLGLPVREGKRRAHALALWHPFPHTWWECPTRDEALRFLRGEIPASLSQETSPENSASWIQIGWNGLGLGWVYSEQRGGSRRHWKNAVPSYLRLKKSWKSGLLSIS